MVHTISKNTLPEELTTKPTVIDAFALWCGPCLHMKPIFHELAEAHSQHYAFAELNVDESRDLAIKFGITSIPAFIFMKEGQIVAKEVGYMSKEDLLAKIKLHLG